MTDYPSRRWSTRFAVGTVVYFLSYTSRQWRNWVGKRTTDLVGELEVCVGFVCRPGYVADYFDEITVEALDPLVLIERTGRPGRIRYRRLESEVFLSRDEAERLLMILVMEP
jgi:hypothetical protein